MSSLALALLVGEWLEFTEFIWRLDYVLPSWLGSSLCLPNLFGG